MSREEAERALGRPGRATPAIRARNRLLFSTTCATPGCRKELNPRYAEAEDALLGQLHHLQTDIYGSRSQPIQNEYIFRNILRIITFIIIISLYIAT